MGSDESVYAPYGAGLRLARPVRVRCGLLLRVRLELIDTGARSLQVCDGRVERTRQHALKPCEERIGGRSNDQRGWP